MASKKLTQLDPVPFVRGTDLLYIVHDVGTVTTSFQTSIDDISTVISSNAITDLTGDVTATGPGSATTNIASNAVTTSKINNSAVTLPKIANASANSVLLGAGASGSGNPYTEISLGSGLVMAGTVISATTGGGGGGSLTVLDGSTTVNNVTVINVTNGTLTDDGGGAVTINTGGGAGGDKAFYTFLAAMMEPLAMEPIQTGTFSYVINGSTTKTIVGAFNTQLGGTGRWERRDVRWPMPLRGVTLSGISSNSCATIIDQALPTYSNARDTYFDRLNTLATATALYFTISTGSTNKMFLPGPYGTILTSLNVYDCTWLIARPYTGSIGWNLANENGDDAAQAWRIAYPVYIPLSKLVTSSLETGVEFSGGDAEASATYYICASSWGEVADPNTYIFRDDFMGTTLDTTTEWTRSQSTSGNVEIDTNWHWLQVKGNNSWGANGIYSQTTTARSAGKQFICDVRIQNESSGAANHNIIVGWSDAAGQSYSNFAHGVDFTASGGVRRLEVFENGNDRGLVGANPGYSENSIYRIRITLGASSATYEIQGGPEYDPIGGSTWTDITPGTSSSTTSPLAIGIARQSNNAYEYVSDMQMIA